MSIGRDYQNNLLDSLRVSKGSRASHEGEPSVANASDDLLLEHLEYQANIRELLDIEMKRPSATKHLGQYSLRITGGSYFDSISKVIDSTATGKPPSITSASDTIQPTDTEEVSGSIVKLSAVDLEANQLAITDLLDTITADPSAIHIKQLELLARLANPDNAPQPLGTLSAGLFAHDRITAAKQSVFIGVGRAVGLLEALKADCLLEIRFEHGVHARALPDHGLSTPPSPLHQRDLSLPQAALKILDSRSDM